MPLLSLSDIRKGVLRCLGRFPPVHTLIVAGLIVALAFELCGFARVQDIWLDESTQLSGITLNFWEMMRWLAGVDPDRLGVPGDRMPPVSYLFDWLWLRICGPSEIGFRLFHSAFVLAGVSGLSIVALRKLGPSATMASLGFLVLSPKLIQTGVEIRAYPIFFAVVCAQVAAFSRLVASNTAVDTRFLILFTAICVTAVYTHFYGVVCSCAFFFALGISFFGRAVPLAAIIGAFLVLAVCSLALAPFLSAATQVLPFVPVTATAPLVANEKGIVQYLTYLLKLFGDSANMVSVGSSICFFGGTIALLSASVFAAGKRMRYRNLTPCDWLIAVVFVGVIATIVASFVAKTFDTMKTSYSGWLLVPLSLLVGAGAASVTGFRPWDAFGRKVATGAMLAGAGASTYMFLVHATMFVHGPRRFIADSYEEVIGPKAVIYEVGAAWGWSYIPLAYSHRDQIVQYRTSDSGTELVRAGRNGTEGIVQDIEATVRPYQTLLLSDIRLRTYRDLRNCQNQSSACPEFPPGAIEGTLLGSGKWRQVGKERSFGLYDCQVTILKRSAVGEN
jgi:hypothetical protein